MLTQELIEIINEPEPGMITATGDVVRELGVLQKSRHFHLNASRFCHLQRICSYSTGRGRLIIAIEKTGAATYLLQLTPDAITADEFEALRSSAELSGGICRIDQGVLIISLQPGCLLEQLTGENGSVFTVTSPTNRMQA